MRRAGRLGLAWGLGHATTLIAFGLPIVFFGRFLPGPVQAGTEALVGLVIVALCTRLLLRWRRGRFHAHVHAHGDVVHRHLHGHEHHEHEHHGHEHEHHEHEHSLVRSPGQAYGIGLAHGLGGSAAVTLLLLASVGSRLGAAAALVVFAAATTLAMTAVSSALGRALAREPVRPRLPRLAPAVGAAGLAFGAWYLAGALPAVL